MLYVQYFNSLGYFDLISRISDISIIAFNVNNYGNVNNNVLSFFDTGFTAQNSVSLSNATEKTSFRFAVTDMRNKDIDPK